MYIESIIMHNWANIPDGAYEPGILTLITGGNACGKTTIGDAVQTVMTASRDKLFQYNPGQDESSQSSRKKTKRTLASYALGCDDGPYARPQGSDTYIGVNFSPNENEVNEPFSAMLAVRARLTEEGAKRRPEEDRLELFIFPNEHIALDDLKSIDGGHWLPIDSSLRGALIAKFGKDRIDSFGDAKDKYLCRLYALYQGRDRNTLPVPEMRQMVKAWVKFMAYKPVDNLDDFVRNSVLEPVDNKAVVEDISSLMRQISEMRSQANHVASSIEVINGGMQKCEELIRNWLKHQENQAVLARGEWTLNLKEYRKLAEEEAQLKREIQELDANLRAWEAEQKQLDDERVEIKSRLQGHAGYREKEQLEQSIETAEVTIRDKVVELVKASTRTDEVKQSLLNLVSICDRPADSIWLSALKGTAETAAVALNDIDGMGNLDSIRLESIRSEDYPSSEDFSNLIKECGYADDALTTLSDELDDAGSGGVSIRDKITTAKTNSTSELTRLEGQRKGLESELTQLERESRVPYSEDVTRALAELNKRLPDAHPRVVGDYIDIIDASWQHAIEGFLGNNKQSIVVDPEFEARAIEMVRDLRSSAKVVQGTKARKDAEKNPPKPKSIVHLMEFGDEYVKAYIIGSVGNVMQVDDAEALRMAARGLTKDGMGSSGYTMFRCWESDRRLMCGKSAREARKRAILADKGEIEAKIQSLSDELANIRVVEGNLANIQALGIKPNLEVAQAAALERESAQRRLATVDVSEVADLQKKFDDISGQIKELSDKEKQARDERGSRAGALYGPGASASRPLKGSLKQRMQSLAAEVERQEDDADALTVQYVDWRRDEEDFDEGAIIDLIQQQSETLDRNALLSMRQSLSRTGHLAGSITQISDAIATYNQTPVESNRIENPFELDEDRDITSERTLRNSRHARHTLRILHQRLANNILVRNQELLARAQARFDETFTSNLVQNILGQIDNAKRTLKELNKELQLHVFDDEHYEFSWSRHKEFGDYLSCFEKLQRLAGQRGDGQLLFEHDELSERDQEILASLRELLLQENDASAANELSRIADYRNYYDYEIFKIPKGKEPIPLSSYGTGSGGQLETPFYVIMAAAYQSAMHFHQGKSHLRFVMIDESFGKLDEKRSRSILDYLVTKLNLQVVFIMPTVKTGPYKSMVTNQIVVQKIADSNPPTGSELKTRVLVDQQRINQDRVADLYKARKKQVTRQTELEFMAKVEEAEVARAENA